MSDVESDSDESFIEKPKQRRHRLPESTPFMIKLMEDIKEERDLSDSSCKLYLARLIKLNDDKVFNDLKFLLDVDKIDSIINEYEPSTRCTFFCAISNCLQPLNKSKTFKHAYNRFGVSGTFPSEDTLEILAIQSVLGPIITEISANDLVKSGTITPMEIKSVILNHNEKEINDRLKYVRKHGAGADAFRYEKEFIQQSEKRLEFIKKIVNMCNKNTLILFHTIEYGQKIFSMLKDHFKNKDFFYIF